MLKNQHFWNIFSVTSFSFFLFRRVVIRLAPGMSLSQKGKCHGTHPFVGLPTGKRTDNNILGPTLLPQVFPKHI
jgi:hypothetical protein